MSERFIAALAALMIGSAALAQQAGDTKSAEPPTEPPVIIDADHTDYDLRSGLTRFNDDVNIQRGAMRVKADRGLARQSDGRISVVELHGNPTTWSDVLEDGTRVDGQAERIHFDVDANVITMTGNARVTHAQGETTADELVYNLTSEKMSARSLSDQRVRVVLESDAASRVQPAENQNENEGEENGNGTEPETDEGPDDALQPADDSVTDTGDGAGPASSDGSEPDPR